MSAPEDLLAFQLRAAKITGWVREHPVCEGRRWRFDFAWPDRQIAVEIDGGIWTRGRHVRGVGIEADHEKLAAAAIAGWRVLRVSPGQVTAGIALGWIERVLQ